MVSNSRSRRNAQQALAGSNQLKEASIEITSTLSIANTLSQVPVLAPVPALYT